MKVNKWLVLLAVAIPGIMIEMAGTSVFVAFEDIASDLNVQIERSVWLTTLYLATNAVMIPLAGWLGKKIGYKKTILAGVVVFAVSALSGATARDFDVLVLSRALQGLGDGPIMPVANALLFEIFPANQRGKMTVVWMLAIGIAPAFGTLVSSWIVEEIGWRGIFYMNVIWATISFVAVMILLPSMKSTTEKVTINWLGFTMLSIATVSLQLVLDRGEHYGWFDSEWILGLAIAFIVSLILYLFVTFVWKNGGVLEFKLLKKLSFLSGNLAFMFLMGVLYSSIMTKILYLQWLIGFTPIYAGNYQAVLSGSMLLFSIIAGILTDKIHPRWPVILGLPIYGYALFLTSRLTLASDIESIMTIAVILGAGVAFVMVPISVAVFASISQKDMGAASVLNSYLSVMGGSVSLAVITSILMHRMDVHTVLLARAIQTGNPAINQAAYTMGSEIALSAAYGQKLRHAAMFAFNDIWYLLLIVSVLLIVYLPFMKRPEHD